MTKLRQANKMSKKTVAKEMLKMIKETNLQRNDDKKLIQQEGIV